MTKRLRLLLIFLISLTFYLSFNASIPVTDPVESNYALTAKEMLLSGDWLSPQIYGHYWFDKPIMIYWLIALSFKFLGITDFAARFPAGLFSAASVAFTYWFGQRIFNNAKIALLSALVLATSLEFWLLAKMIITDSVLFFYTSISLAMLYLGLKTTASSWYMILAYITAALAVLTKGPVGLVLPGLIVCSYIVFTRQWQLFKKIFILPGGLAFLVIAAPWYIKMYQIHGQFFVDTFLGLHNYLRATVSEHPKYNVFYYYLVLFPISLLPWVGVLIKSINVVSKETRSSQLIYLVNWVVITIIFYTMMATKYPTYVFPAAFPAALLIGYTLEKMQTIQGRKVWFWLSIPTIALLGMIAFSGGFLLNAVNWTFIYIVVLLSIFLLLWIQYKGNVHYLPQVVALVTVIMSLLLIHNGLIPLAETRSGKNIVAMLPAAQDAKIASYGDYSTSVVFYSGYTIPKLINEEDNQQHGVWSGKYTMPTETIKSFNSYTKSYILVKNNEKANFSNEPFSKQFLPIANDITTTLYQRTIP